VTESASESEEQGGNTPSAPSTLLPPVSTVLADSSAISTALEIYTRAYQRMAVQDLRTREATNALTAAFDQYKEAEAGLLREQEKQREVEVIVGRWHHILSTNGVQSPNVT
jgi:hypothetical protein